MASDKPTPRETLDNIREATFRKFAEQGDGKPVATEVAIGGSVLEAVDSSMAALRKRFEEKRAVIALVCFIGSNAEGNPDCGIELLSVKLTAGDVLAFSTSNMPAQVGDMAASVLRRGLEAQVKELIEARLRANGIEEGN